MKRNLFLSGGGGGGASPQRTGCADRRSRTDGGMRQFQNRIWWKKMLLCCFTVDAHGSRKMVWRGILTVFTQRDKQGLKLAGVFVLNIVNSHIELQPGLYLTVITPARDKAGCFIWLQATVCFSFTKWSFAKTFSELPLGELLVASWVLHSSGRWASRGQECTGVWAFTEQSRCLCFVQYMTCWYVLPWKNEIYQDYVLLQRLISFRRAGVNVFKKERVYISKLHADMIFGNDPASIFTIIIALCFHLRLQDLICAQVWGGVSHPIAWYIRVI